MVWHGLPLQPVLNPANNIHEGVDVYYSEGLLCWWVRQAMLTGYPGRVESCALTTYLRIWKMRGQERRLLRPLGRKRRYVWKYGVPYLGTYTLSRGGEYKSS